jgi:hypothetical protein
MNSTIRHLTKKAPSDLEQTGQAVVTMAVNLYENAEFTVNGVTDQNVTTAQGLFDVVTKAHYVEIRTDAAISVKFNSTSNDAISISTTDSPYKMSVLAVENIFLTSVGSANVKVFIA